MTRHHPTVTVFFAVAGLLSPLGAACTASVEAPETADAPDTGAALVAGGTQTFSGSVNRRNRRSQSFSVDADADGTLTLDLRWSTTSANLDLRLLDESGVLVASAATNTVGRETLQRSVRAGDSFTAVVRAQSGSSSFTLTASLVGAGTTDPGPTPTPSATTTFVAKGSAWKYDDTGADLGTTWRTATFSDAAWKTGTAELGYGDGNERTVISFGANASLKHPTAYFRRTFAVADATKVTALVARVMRDDGAVVYLNGTEVMRSNMPAGTVAFGTLASGDAGNESTYHEVTIPPARLVTGNNVIAVEVHQATRDSSDLSFDAELVASISGTITPPPPPACGDNACNGTETCSSCSADCGACPPPPPSCGDRICNGTETCSSCSADCGACPPPPPSCGDNACNGTETCSSCSADCGACPPPPPSCGDRTCNGTETCSSCSADCGVCPPPPPPEGTPVPLGSPGPWTLKFRDEFDGTSLDLSKWRPNWFGATDTAITRPINDLEVTCYDPAQVRVSNGTLKLAAVATTKAGCIKKDGSRANFASGLISSYDHYHFTYGFMEARIFLPPGSGTPENWVAWWTNGDNWPEDGEIDILETLGGHPRWHYHYDGGGGRDASFGSPTSLNSTWGTTNLAGWHTFGAEWAPGRITFYYDGVNVGSVTSNVTSSPHYLIMNYGINGNHPIVVPSTAEVDYIRHWQR